MARIINRKELEVRTMLRKLNEVAETRNQKPSNHVTCGEHQEHAGISETFQNITKWVSTT